MHSLLYIFTSLSVIYQSTMDKSGNNEPKFSFTKLTGVNNDKIWARKIRYFPKSAELLDHTFPDNKNPKPIAIIFKEKELEDDAKLEHHEKYTDKIMAWTKNNVKCKDYIGCICFDNI